MRIKMTGVCLALCFWVVNPAYLAGCGGETGFSFGQEDMLALMDSVAAETWTVEKDSERYTLEFDLEQSETLELTRRQPPGLLGNALACEDRSFVASASACIDMSYLGIRGRVTIRDLTTGQEVLSAQVVTGTMRVIGLHLSNSVIELTHTSGRFEFISETGESFHLSESSW